MQSAAIRTVPILSGFATQRSRVLSAPALLRTADPAVGSFARVVGVLHLRPQQCRRHSRRRSQPRRPAKAQRPRRGILAILAQNLVALASLDSLDMTGTMSIVCQSLLSWKQLARSLEIIQSTPHHGGTTSAGPAPGDAECCYPDCANSERVCNTEEQSPFCTSSAANCRSCGGELCTGGGGSPSTTPTVPTTLSSTIAATTTSEGSTTKKGHS